MPNDPRPRTSLPCSLALGLALAACGEPDFERDARSASAPEVTAPESQVRRDMRPEAVEARRLLDAGEARLARPLVERLVDVLGVEGPLLRARLTFLEGDETAWLTDVEKARNLDPRDPRPYATAAEIWAALDRRLASKEEIERGKAAAGRMTPELDRALALLHLVTPGQAKVGLEILEAARRADGELPFVGRAFGQAHYLAAQRALANDEPELALERLATSLEWDPEDFDARFAEAELRIKVAKDFDGGLESMERLLEDGMPVHEEVGKFSWSAGLIEQVQQRPEKALQRYLRARELGYPGVDQGTSHQFLQARADTRVREAIRLVREGDREGADEGAREILAAAFELLPTEAAARRRFADAFAAEADGALDAGDRDVAARLIRTATWLDAAAPSVAVVSGSLYFAKALEAVEAQDADTAMAFAVRATEVVPTDSLMWVFRGELEYATGAYGDAAASLDRGLLLAEASGEPVEIDTILLMAECYVVTGDDEAAIGTLKQGIAAVRNGSDAGGADSETLEEARTLLRALEGG